MKQRLTTFGQLDPSKIPYESARPTPTQKSQKRSFGDRFKDNRKSRERKSEAGHKRRREKNRTRHKNQAINDRNHAGNRSPRRNRNSLAETRSPSKPRYKSPDYRRPLPEDNRQGRDQMLPGHLNSSGRNRGRGDDNRNYRVMVETRGEQNSVQRVPRTSDATRTARRARV